MGGQDGTRGYLLQAIIAVLQSFSNPNWAYISLEPKEESEKVDIKWWDSNNSITVYQVKSSINNFNKSEILQVANDLILGSSNADSFILVFIGTYSSGTKTFFKNFHKRSVSELGNYGNLHYYRNRITFDLKGLDISALDAQIESNVHAYLDSQGHLVPHATLKLISLGLTAQFTRFATEGIKISQMQLLNQVNEWLRYNYPKELKKDKDQLILAIYNNNKFETKSTSIKRSLEDRAIAHELDKIKSELYLLIDEIDAIKLPPPPETEDHNNPYRIKPFVPMPIGLTISASFGSGKIKEIVTKAKQQLKIDLLDDFFNVGNATEPSVTLLSMITQERQVSGTSDEVKKVKLLDSISYKLNKLQDLRDWWSEIEIFSVLPLVIANEGNVLHTNIDLQISIPKTVSILTSDSFPIPEYKSNLELLSMDGDILQNLFVMNADSQIKKI